MARGANGLVAAEHASTRSFARAVFRTAQREARERTNAHLNSEASMSRAVCAGTRVAQPAE
eukprot:3299544-Pyramimonas_sp.AAC.1